MKAELLLVVLDPQSIEKRIRGNSPSEKSYPGSFYLYWQSLLRSGGARSPRNSIDSLPRKERVPALVRKKLEKRTCFNKKKSTFHCFNFKK